MVTLMVSKFQKTLRQLLKIITCSTIGMTSKLPVWHSSKFEFRFGGIELASGTKVELENNKVFSNKNLIQKCLDSGECLYKLTSFKYYPIQNHYRCLTCNSSGKSCLCLYQPNAIEKHLRYNKCTGKTRKRTYCYMRKLCKKLPCKS